VLSRLSPRRVWAGLLVALAAVMAGLGLWVSGLDFQDTAAVTAHRGSSKKAPENTLAALRQAIEDGADYIEIDVQTTKDGRVILLHDADFMRLAGDPRKLAELTLAEAQQIDLGRRFDPRFAGEHAPTLAAAIETVRGRARLNIELKYNRPDPKLIPAVLAVLERERFTEQCVLTSLSAHALAEVRRRNPKLRVGQIVTQSVGNLMALDVDFFSVNRATLTGAFVERAHRAGKAVHVWTVNTAAVIHHVLDLGVDNLITDHPALARQVLAERADLSPPERLALRLRHLIQD
jgi:glycerophosphoryl diester phosphodiesterase